ncbi:protein rep [Fusobacterium polymorphum]
MFTTYNNKNGSKNQEPILNYSIIFLISIFFIGILEKTKIINYLLYKINVKYIIFIGFFVAVYNTIGDINYFINRKKIIKIERIKEKLIKKFYKKEIVPIIVKKLDPILNSEVIEFKFKREEEARTFLSNIKKYNIEKLLKIINNFTFIKIVKEEKEKEEEKLKKIEIIKLIRIIKEVEEQEVKSIAEAEAISLIVNREEASEEIEIKRVKKLKVKKIKDIEEVEDYLKKPTEKKRMQYKFIELMKNNKLVSLKNLNVARLQVCGDFLLFLKSKNNAYRLKKANLCNNRFCPLCSSLRAKKNAVIVLELMEYIREINKLEFVFFTLTAPNIVGEKLEEEIKEFNNSFKELIRSKEFRKVCKGYIRKLEVTYNRERADFHPHFHIVMAVNKSYFKSKDYISTALLKTLWRKFKKNDSIEAVDMRKVKMNSIKEVLEIASYCTKSSDLYDNGQEVFDYFYSALRGKQEITYSGIFADVKKLRDNGELKIENIKSLEEIQEKAIEKVWHKWKKENQEYYKYFKQELTKEEQEKFYNLDLANININ